MAGNIQQAAPIIGEKSEIGPAVTGTLPCQVGRPVLTEGAGGWLERVELVTPAMCGHNSLFVGQLGDWTWDAVGAMCRINPYAATDPAGNPVYLSFAYFRVKASSELCAEDLTFGDRLRIRSKVLSCGGDSLLTLHQVCRDSDDPHDDPARDAARDAARDPARGVPDFFRYDAPGSIHVETYNRWIQRTDRNTNHGLMRATPAGFQIDHLERIAKEHTPRRTWTETRKMATFRSAGEPEPQARLAVTYRVDASRDLNGAGLLYFASYFSIVDQAVLRMWRALGRTTDGFLRRRVLDRQLCFVANADAEDILDLEVTSHRGADGLDVVDVTVRHQNGNLLAVSRQCIRDTATRAGGS